MANDLRYVVEKKEDGTWKGFAALKADMDGFNTGRWMITIRKYRKSRTNKQNAYYHGCVIPFVKDGLIDMGFDRHLLSDENVHHMLRDKFLKEDMGISEGEHAGEFVTMVKSTTDLTTTEFMDYIADIQKWSAEWLNVVIPDPEEQAKINF